MATIKHTSSKNSDLSAAERYLIFQHNEYTSLPILDELGRPKLREHNPAISKHITISSALTRGMQPTTV